MSGVRTFVAIELSDLVKVKLAQLQTSLKRATACPVKWVEPEGIHLTLCFLGELSLAQIEIVKGVIARISMRFAPLQLETSRLGAFPSILHPQTLWMGLTGELAALTELHRQLEANLCVVGYQPESRPFKPHLTIARVQSEATPAARRGLGEALSRLDAVSLPVGVLELTLMKSTLNPAGAVYTRLYRAELICPGAGLDT